MRRRTTRARWWRALAHPVRNPVAVAYARSDLFARRRRLMGDWGDYLDARGDGTTITRRQGREKGVDVRIAIDLITLAYRRKYDVAVVFSQDQDLSEVAVELKRISRKQEPPLTSTPQPTGVSRRGAPSP